MKKLVLLVLVMLSTAVYADGNDLSVVFESERIDVDLSGVNQDTVQNVYHVDYTRDFSRDLYGIIGGSIGEGRTRGLVVNPHQYKAIRFGLGFRW